MAFTLTNGYFQNRGVDVMAFDDIYPEGHQSGVSVIMHGCRVAANGDIRFEQTPGQWQPVPKQGERVINEKANTITTTLSFPDPERMKGVNPMIYPDFTFNYTVTVTGKDTAVIVAVDLDRPVPERFLGKLSFNLELFPASLFGKPWIMDKKQGIFPPQPNGPVIAQPSNHTHTGTYDPIVADDLIAEPYAVGRRLTVRPDDPNNRLTIETEGAGLRLYDGRMNHNNGWFVVSSEVPAGAAGNAVKWVITPNVEKDWLSPPVIQHSQVGYHPAQAKTAVIELDKRETQHFQAALYRLTENGFRQVYTNDARRWGSFLRYDYEIFDFSHIKEEGLYRIQYGAELSSVFRIAPDIYDRGVWQPVLEYFLPVQMCHMRVAEKYRVWHGLCHTDDACMAPLNHNHFDGYIQGPSTLTKYAPGDPVPGLNIGGWHDAGDFDLRVESQAGEVYALVLAYEAFGVDYDATFIDQETQIAEIHQPDGKNDILQQIEHGVLSVVGAYRSLGRLYRGIIEADLRQYVHLGDSAVMGGGRLVFTEDNPPRELTAAAHLAAASRALKGFNDTLSAQALEAARELYSVTAVNDDLARAAGVHAAAELFLTTGERAYKDHLIKEAGFAAEAIGKLGWIAARADKALGDEGFSSTIRGALPGLRDEYAAQSAETPYGIPYRPHIWGAGWGIQRLGVQAYFLHNAYPGFFGPDMVFNALNFVLGCHPGPNNSSFASGVGARSALTGYGINRADWSYIPGGVISGTALIRPDYPELLDFPFLWQQTEYVMGGGSSHYMFLVLAARHLLNGGG